MMFENLKKEEIKNFSNHKPCGNGFHYHTLFANHGLRFTKTILEMTKLPRNFLKTFSNVICIYV